jgi:hypothetical protein
MRIPAESSRPREYTCGATMKKLLALLLVFALHQGLSSTETSALEGTWLQTGNRWVNAPATIDPHLQSSQTAVLYFGQDHTFALIYCTVYRSSRKHLTMSNGDPRGVYKGEWASDGNVVSVTYHLVEATIPPPRQKIPDAEQRATIKISQNSSLVFERKTFHREVRLDNSIHEAVYGIQPAQALNPFPNPNRLASHWLHGFSSSLPLLLESSFVSEMKTRMLFCVLAIAISGSSQEKGKYAGFTKSPTEHIINELKQPFEVESIRGVVTRQEGDQEPLQNVLVEIKGPGDHDKIRRAKTDEHGQFKINYIPAGTYKFKATLGGFQSVVGTIIVSKKGSKEQ